MEWPLVAFGREFDEALLQRIPDVFYEDDIIDLPSAPDVSNYLISEVNQGRSLSLWAATVFQLIIKFFFLLSTVQDDTSASNGNKDPLCYEGMTDVEVERRMKVIYTSVNVNAVVFCECLVLDVTWLNVVMWQMLDICAIIRWNPLCNFHT